MWPWTEYRSLPVTVYICQGEPFQQSSTHTRNTEKRCYCVFHMILDVSMCQVFVTEIARFVQLVNLSLKLENSHARIAHQAHIQVRMVPLYALNVPADQTQNQAALSLVPACVTLGGRGPLVETAHCAWQGHTSCTKELLVVCFAPRANILRSRVQFRKTPARIVH